MTHQARFNNTVFTEITLQTRFNNIAFEGFSLDNNLLITRRGLTRRHKAALFFLIKKIMFRCCKRVLKKKKYISWVINPIRLNKLVLF
jgi:hypothetical protein